MSFDSAFPRLGEPIGFTASGEPIYISEAFQRFFEASHLRLGGDEDTVSGIVTGTKVLQDINANSIGSISERLDAIESNQATQSATTSAATGALSATASPTSAGATDAPGNVATNSVTVTPTGGTAPYSYEWIKKSGGAITAVTPSANATTFTAFIGSGEIITASFCCRVTDDASAQFDVAVSVSIYGESGAREFAEP